MTDPISLTTDVAAWIAVALALIALVGIVGPLLLLRESRSERSQALNEVDSQHGYVSKGLSLGRRGRIFHTVKVPDLILAIRLRGRYRKRHDRGWATQVNINAFDITIDDGPSIIDEVFEINSTSSKALLRGITGSLSWTRAVTATEAPRDQICFATLPLSARQVLMSRIMSSATELRVELSSNLCPCKALPLIAAWSTGLKLCEQAWMIVEVCSPSPTLSYQRLKMATTTTRAIGANFLTANIAMDLQIFSGSHTFTSYHELYYVSTLVLGVFSSAFKQSFSISSVGGRELAQTLYEVDEMFRKRPSTLPDDVKDIIGILALCSPRFQLQLRVITSQVEHARQEINSGERENASFSVKIDMSKKVICTAIIVGWQIEHSLDFSEAFGVEPTGSETPQIYSHKVDIILAALRAGIRCSMFPSTLPSEPLIALVRQLGDVIHLSPNDRPRYFSQMDSSQRRNYGHEENIDMLPPQNRGYDERIDMLPSQNRGYDERIYTQEIAHMDYEGIEATNYENLQLHGPILIRPAVRIFTAAPESPQSSPPTSSLLSSEDGASSADDRPVWTRCARRYLSLETLVGKNIDFQVDINDSDYVLIERWVPQDELATLFKDSRKLRKKRETLRQRIQAREIVLQGNRLLLAHTYNNDNGMSANENENEGGAQNAEQDRYENENGLFEPVDASVGTFELYD
ncbi:hypothetical protein N431DRAFT_453865 [Stipitochalara longipes BDJ]|nr:hypothetical protein N431DRAFT_453865 [Stipitochalara longipes BDJ]